MHRDRIVLSHPAGSEAVISPHGAQLLGWRTPDGAEQLYLPPDAQPGPGRALRGGAPICFPQFGERGPLAKHGFARQSLWRVRQAESRLDQPCVAFELAAGPIPDWPHTGRVSLEVRLGPSWLESELEVANLGDRPFAFTAAIHTYLRVDDVRAARLAGLRGCQYEDALDGLRRKPEGADALAFDGELDRVYVGSPSALQLIEPGRPPRRILQRGFADTVVWNPGPAKAARLGDMPPGDWLRMLCVEAGSIATPVIVPAGGRWGASQRLEVPAATA